MTSWAPTEFVILAFSRELGARDVANLVDAIFESVLDCAGSDYGVDVELFRVPQQRPRMDPFSSAVR